mmetsp:Transcript_81202/g.226039  ORF Transcript_81202/g.226039 Transcript_81202/m.226039 type:complete len:456 (+) Transcript_81202:80-1447(+)
MKRARVRADMARAPAPSTGHDTVVLDSGGGFVRAGFASETRPRVNEPNCSADAVRPVETPLALGEDARKLPACTLHRPTNSGLLLDLDQQQAIWDTVLSRPAFSTMAPTESSILVTEALCTPKVLRSEVAEVLFEYFGFRQVGIVPAPHLALHSPGLAGMLDKRNPCCTLLDVGFSGCAAVPCLERRPVANTSRRSGVGGQLLTNLLGDRLRLRHYDLSSNWLLTEDIFASTCMVSANFDADLRSRFMKVGPAIYELPDFKRTWRGSLLKDAAPEPPGRSGVGDPQRVTLKAERVVVAEALFNPRDHGIRAAGVADVVTQAVRSVHDMAIQTHLGQVAVCGGLARLPHFTERLQRELRERMPPDSPVTVVAEAEPELSAWCGGAHLVREDPEFRANHIRSKSAWFEEGPRRTSALGRHVKAAVPRSTTACGGARSVESSAGTAAAASAKRPILIW